MSDKQDPRTDFQKENAEELAKSLRILADIVEKGIIRDYRIETHNGYVEERLGQSIARYLNGAQQFEIYLDIYNPDMDKRSEYIKDLMNYDSQ